MAAQKGFRSTVTKNKSARNVPTAKSERSLMVSYYFFAPKRDVKVLQWT